MHIIDDRPLSNSPEKQLDFFGVYRFSRIFFSRVNLCLFQGQTSEYIHIFGVLLPTRQRQIPLCKILLPTVGLQDVFIMYLHPYPYIHPHNTAVKQYTPRGIVKQHFYMSRKSAQKITTKSTVSVQTIHYLQRILRYKTNNLKLHHTAAELHRKTA